MSGSLWPNGLQHNRLPCPSLAPRACSNSCPLSLWCHPTVLSSATPFRGLHAHSLSQVWLFMTPWIVARQVPLSMGFSWQEYWSGLPFPSLLKRLENTLTPWVLAWSLGEWICILRETFSSSAWLLAPLVLSEPRVHMQHRIGFSLREIDCWALALLPKATSKLSLLFKMTIKCFRIIPVRKGVGRDLHLSMSIQTMLEENPVSIFTMFEICPNAKFLVCCLQLVALNLPWTWDSNLSISDWRS